MASSIKAPTLEEFRARAALTGLTLTEEDIGHLHKGYVGLLGLMDGSVSTLAPLFAAAFATHDTWATFLVGMAASIGAGISMGLAEGLSDDGKLTGRVLGDIVEARLAQVLHRADQRVMVGMGAWIRERGQLLIQRSERLLLSG